MVDLHLLAAADLAALVADLRCTGCEVVAPVSVDPGTTAYRVIESSDEAKLLGTLPRLSLKELFLPPSEPLLSWRYQDGGGVTLQAACAGARPRLIIGARPCDAAALDIVDKVMDWQPRDELWFGRRRATTIIGIACPNSDDSCCCRVLGLAPDATRGSDLFLRPAADGSLLVEVVTDKGEALLAEHPARFPAAAGAPGAAQLAGGDAHEISIAAVQAWLQTGFGDALWEELAAACHGCGVCAAVCPTCHCFDIVDEPEGVTHGVRRRCWDTCQTSRFTVHASGHNPRSHQGARLRQRLLHKLQVYPARFGDLLCTGCGRCARSCPAGIDLPEILSRLSSMANASAK